ncbi:hypothetical protein PQQ87_38155 [Paraburkholderia nemoris]|uniref:hypothetical protein n=1 Tax=Paraburkholderia nemoris TaxID=2793076 RepID=UPI0038B6F54A
MTAMVDDLPVCTHADPLVFAETGFDPAIAQLQAIHLVLEDAEIGEKRLSLLAAPYGSTPAYLLSASSLRSAIPADKTTTRGLRDPPATRFLGEPFD